MQEQYVKIGITDTVIPLLKGHLSSQARFQMN